MTFTLNFTDNWQRTRLSFIICKTRFEAFQASKQAVKQASCQYGKVARSHAWAARERRPEVSASPLTRAFLRVSFRLPEMDSLLAGSGVYCNNFVKLSG